MSEICLATSGVVVGVAPLSVTELVLDLTKPANMNLLLALALKVSDLAELSAVAVTCVRAVSALTIAAKSLSTSAWVLILAKLTELPETAKLP